MPANATDIGQLKPKEGLFSRHSNRIDGNGGPVPANVIEDDPDFATWWLDILSPTDDEMKMLSKVGFETLNHAPAESNILISRSSIFIH